MNYQEAVEYVDRLAAKKSIVLGLSTMRELLKRLGDPQDSLSFIHVAGTNGKGSVLAFLASVCREAGYRTGLYQSPSVFSYCEKIQVNGEPISEEDMAELLTRAAKAGDAMEAEGLPHPTAFETETAAAFLYFKEQGCDLVALETGMGGAEDATNVIEHTVCSVIMQVGMDHMKYLGNTVEEIARAKGGIIKPGRPAVLCGQSAAVEQVIREICEEKGAPLTVSRPELAQVTEEGLSGTSFEYGRFRNVRISLLGKHQVANACTALEAVRVLRSSGYDISGQAVYDGMARAVWPGRFEVIGRSPVFVMDGAHNPDAAGRLADSIKLYFTNRRILYIMGILADKDYRKVTELTASLAERIYTVTPENPRALPAKELAACIEETRGESGFTGQVKAEESLKDAVRDALAEAGRDDVIVAFGSLSYLGKLKETLKEITCNG